jgi:hypothetical protein
MVRAARFTGVAALVALVTIHGVAQAVYESKPTTLTATVVLVEKGSRIVTLKTSAGNWLHVTAPDEMEGFDTLKVGDVVTATYFKAVAVRLRKPGDAPPPAAPTTIVRRKDDTPGSRTMREQSVRATVATVDPSAPSLEVKTADGEVRSLEVTDAAQLKNIKAGDTLDVTYYESLLVSVAHPKKD